MPTHHQQGQLPCAAMVLSEARPASPSSDHRGCATNRSAPPLGGCCNKGGGKMKARAEENPRTQIPVGTIRSFEIQRAATVACLMNAAMGSLVAVIMALRRCARPCVPMNILPSTIARSARDQGPSLCRLALAYGTNSTDPHRFASKFSAPARRMNFNHLGPARCTATTPEREAAEPRYPVIAPVQGRLEGAWA